MTSEIVVAPKHEVLTQEEGKSLLHKYMRRAARSVKRAENQITLAVLRLHKIREDKLFQFGYDSWKDCLDDFCINVGKKKSTFYKLLKITRSAQFLGREFGQFMRLTDGIRTIEPIFDGPGRIVEDYDRVTGEIKAVRHGWEERLPPGDNLTERVWTWIDENVGGGITSDMLRSSIRNEVKEKDEYRFSIVHDAAGHHVDTGWNFELVDGTYDEGTSQKSMPPNVYRVYCAKLGIPREFR